MDYVRLIDEKLRTEAIRSIRASIIEFEKSGTGREMTPDDEIKLLSTADTGYFPEEFDNVLIYLALAHIYMADDGKIAQAQSYRAQAKAFFDGYIENDTLGKTLRRPASRNRFTTLTAGRI